MFFFIFLCFLCFFNVVFLLLLKHRRTKLCGILALLVLDM